MKIIQTHEIDLMHKNISRKKKVQVIVQNVEQCAVRGGWMEIIVFSSD